jgi:ribosome biogenesis ATPase
MIDPAMVRPGRLDKLLYVDLPSPRERLEILKTHTKRTPIDAEAWEGIGAIVMGEKCDGFSGADIAALVREAATLALRSALERVGAFENDLDRGTEGRGEGDASMAEAADDHKDVRVTVEHFAKAAVKTLPSVSREQRLRYERMRDKYAGVPTKGRRMREEPDGEVTGSVGAAGTAMM